MKQKLELFPVCELALTPLVQINDLFVPATIPLGQPAESPTLEARLLLSLPYQFQEPCWYLTVVLSALDLFHDSGKVKYAQVDPFRMAVCARVKKPSEKKFEVK